MSRRQIRFALGSVVVAFAAITVGCSESDDALVADEPKSTTTTSTTVASTTTEPATNSTTTTSTTTTTVAPPTTTVPPSLRLGTSELWIDQTATFTARGFAPGSRAVATLFSDPVRIGTATVRQDGTARFSVRIPQIEPGDHSLVISGTNQEGEQATVSRPVVIGVDVTPPALVDVTAAVSSVDITAGSTTFNVDISASDLGTGIIAGGAMFTGCGMSGASGFWNDLTNDYPAGNIVSGSKTNGTWRVPVTVTAGLSACTLELFAVDLCDAANQCVTIREGLPSVSVSVVNNDNPDVAPPVLGSVTVSVDSVDITSGPATFTVDISATDEGTGITAGGAMFIGCGASGASGFWNDLTNDYPAGNIVSGTDTNGTWRVSLTVPAGIAACTLQLFAVDLCDAANQCVTIRESLPALSVAVTRSD